MRVLFITEFFPSSLDLKFTGGVEARTFFIVQALSKKNKALVICRKTQKIRKSTLFTGVQTPGVCVYPCGLLAFNIEANFLSVFGRVIFIFVAILKGLSLDFDLVEGSNFVTYLPAFFLGLIKKKPVVAWYADVFKGKWIKLFGLIGIFGEVIERISLKLPWTKVIALSRVTKDKLIRAGVDKKKIEVIYGGVEIEKSKVKSQKLKVKNIICISRLVKYKRVRDLIIAFSQLAKQYSDLSLTIVGQGPEEKRLKRLVKKKGLSQKKVRFLKNMSRNKLINLLKKSYIFCLPSIVEGFGLSTIEAVACQTPYVISDIKVNKEVTNNGQGGLLFKKKNVKDLAEKLKILLKNKNIYHKKQKEGLALAKSYDWGKIANQTYKVYHEAFNEQI